MATMSFKRPRRKGFTRDDFILACLRRQSGKTNHRAEAGSSVDDRGGIVGERGPVLAGKKMPDYFLPAGGLGVACGAASALATAASAFSATDTRPSALRTSVSILAAMSLFSFRNCLAFSRPWPTRSPL